MSSSTESCIRTEKSREFWKRYRIEKKGTRLGEGRYGSVWRAKDEETGDTVAIKKIVIEDIDAGIPATTMREITILRLLADNPHVIQLRDVFYDFDRGMFDCELNLVFDCMSCDLRKYIHRRSSPIPDNIIKLCTGLRSMHGRGMFHRDLKPQNILIDTTQEDEPSLKIADFGLGRTHALPVPQLTHEIGSLYYRAPEVLLGAEYYSHAVDMWSVGCIFAEFFLRKALFCGSGEFHQLVKIFETMGTPTLETWSQFHTLTDYHEYPCFKQYKLRERFEDGIDDKAFDLLEQLLTYDPAKRISIVATLEHSYFDEMRSETDEPSSADKEEKEVDVTKTKE